MFYDLEQIAEGLEHIEKIIMPTKHKEDLLNHIEIQDRFQWLGRWQEFLHETTYIRELNKDNLKFPSNIEQVFGDVEGNFKKYMKKYCNKVDFLQTYKDFVEIHTPYNIYYLEAFKEID